MILVIRPVPTSIRDTSGRSASSTEETGRATETPGLGALESVGFRYDLTEDRDEHADLNGRQNDSVSGRYEHRHARCADTDKGGIDEVVSDEHSHQESMRIRPWFPQGPRL